MSRRSSWLPYFSHEERNIPCEHFLRKTSRKEAVIELILVRRQSAFPFPLHRRYRIQVFLIEWTGAASIRVAPTCLPWQCLSTSAHIKRSASAIYRAPRFKSSRHDWDEHIGFNDVEQRWENIEASKPRRKLTKAKRATFSAYTGGHESYFCVPHNV